MCAVGDSKRDMGRYRKLHINQINDVNSLLPRQGLDMSEHFTRTHFTDGLLCLPDGYEAVASPVHLGLSPACLPPASTEIDEPGLTGSKHTPKAAARWGCQKAVASSSHDPGPGAFCSRPPIVLQT